MESFTRGPSSTNGIEPLRDADVSELIVARTHVSNNNTPSTLGHPLNNNIHQDDPAAGRDFRTPHCSGSPPFSLACGPSDQKLKMLRRSAMEGTEERILQLGDLLQQVTAADREGSAAVLVGPPVPAEWKEELDAAADADADFLAEQQAAAGKKGQSQVGSNGLGITESEHVEMRGVDPKQVKVKALKEGSIEKGDIDLSQDKVKSLEEENTEMEDRAPNISPGSARYGPLSEMSDRPSCIGYGKKPLETVHEVDEEDSDWGMSSLRGTTPKSSSPLFQGSPSSSNGHGGSSPSEDDHPTSVTDDWGPPSGFECMTGSSFSSNRSDTMSRGSTALNFGPLLSSLRNPPVPGAAHPDDPATNPLNRSVDSGSSIPPQSPLPTVGGLPRWWRPGLARLLDRWFHAMSFPETDMGPGNRPYAKRAEASSIVFTINEKGEGRGPSVEIRIDLSDVQSITVLEVHTHNSLENIKKGDHPGAAGIPEAGLWTIVRIDEKEPSKNGDTNPTETRSRISRGLPEDGGNPKPWEIIAFPTSMITARRSWTAKHDASSIREAPVDLGPAGMLPRMPLMFFDLPDLGPSPPLPGTTGGARPTRARHAAGPAASRPRTLAKSMDKKTKAPDTKEKGSRFLQWDLDVSGRLPLMDGIGVEPSFWRAWINAAGNGHGRIVIEQQGTWGFGK